MSEVSIPDSWVWTTLGEICTKPQYGYTTKAAESGDTLLLRTTDITSGAIDWNTVPFCAESPDDPDKYRLYDGDIVISRAGSVGFGHLVRSPPDAVFASYLIRFRTYTHRQYFALFLKSPFYWRSISDSKSGIAVSNVNAQKLAAIPIPLPPLAEQKRIVAKIEELFSELDAGEESLRHARRQLGVYRQSLLKQAFEGKLTEQWREEHPELLESPDQLLARIQAERQEHYQQQLKEWEKALKQWEKGGKGGKRPAKPREPQAGSPIDKDCLAELPVLPECWTWATAETNCDVVRGGSPRPAGDPKYYDGEIPFLKVADLTRVDGPYVDRFTATIKEAGLQKTRFVAPPVLMISNSGATLGVPRICRIAATFNDGIAAFLDLDPETHLYFYYFWTSKTKALRNINQGAAQPNLNTDLLKTYPIPLCSLPEQREIVRILDAQFEVIEENEREIDAGLKRSAALRQSILKMAFSGRLVPQDPTDEPASVLLERIRAERAASPAKASKKRSVRSV